MHEEGSMFIAHFLGCFLSFFKGVSRLDYFTSVAYHSLFLHVGGILRHDDVGEKVKRGSSIGKCLRMVPRGVRADRCHALIELQQFIKSSPRLESPNLLQIFALEVQLRTPCHLRNGLTGEQWRPMYKLADSLMRINDHLFGYHRRQIYQQHHILEFPNPQVSKMGWRQFSLIILQNLIMQSQSTIPELHEYDVILVGNLAAVAGDLLSAKTNLYKLVSTHFQTQIQQPSLFPINSTQIKVQGKSKHIEIIRQKIIRINPIQRYVLLEGNKKISYKIMVYGEQSSKWAGLRVDHPFFEAISTPQSLVYSNYNANWQKLLSCKPGNLIFYVSKQPNIYEQNYPFLYFYEKFTAENRRKMRFIIVLEGSSFFPYCPLANRIFEQQLKASKFRIIYNTRIEEVDYMKRVVRIVGKEGPETISYSSIYCCLPQSTPKILEKSHIDPYKIHQKFLHNLQHDSIYVIGGSTLPTTHSFAAINHQLHVIVNNIKVRLDHISQPIEQLLFASYRGTTSIRIILSEKQLLEIDHGYKDHEHEIKKGCSCFNFMLSEHLDVYLAEKYYNFKSFGMPHYICSPWNLTEQQITVVIDQGDQSLVEFKGKSPKI